MSKMAVRFFGFLLLMLLLWPGLVGAETDRKGSKDHPLFTRMPDTYIMGYRQVNFDAYTFTLPNRGKERVEGKFFLIEYQTKKGQPRASALEIVRNHQAAITQIGGEVLYDDNNHITTLRLIKDGQEIWAKVDSIQGRYTLIIVEKKAMKQSISSKAIFDQLSQKGFMVIDVHFDTAKAIIKPESYPLIDQVAGMLKQHPELKVSVEGYTDNVGSPQANQKLSEARAQAVVAALTAKGVAASRLQAKGWGEQKPVADNATAAGQALNRRVELRKM
ncbi:OmpA family protein [Desulfoferula mesophila]|uniref:Membrane protein n=1 Tax=Desulfoferula mesophila TaxID=3058419 RepID=A0AAU9E986_9BACT|nr:membrane protein [Desulfoferula mesophilus]